MRPVACNDRQEQALSNADPAEALFFTGIQHMAAGELQCAETCFRNALQIAPDFAEALVNLGLLLEQLNDSVAAEACYRRSIILNPGYPETHLNLGALLAGRKRFAEAEAAYNQAIALRPDAAAGWSNLGALYACCKREIEAEQCYRTALLLDESYAIARFNLSYVLLRQGRLEEGWRCLEARNWYAKLAAQLSCPRWQGEALSGKAMLIGYEAGHGDMIQFYRYAAVLKALGAGSVSIICHPALKSLFAAQGTLDQVFSFTDPVPTTGWDFWTPPLSIPCYCHTRLDNIPANIPYLQAAPVQVEKWAAHLPQHGLRVGLAWKGNPLFENDADRSIPSLDMLAPLGAVSGIRFISLQKGGGETEASHPPMPLQLCQLTDFSDTAAVVANLDLVICVDTAVAHLAGALGKPCWVLLPDYKTDWRWLKERTDTPWYPGVMRLFRQSAMGDWKAMIAQVATALELWAADQIPR